MNHLHISKQVCSGGTFDGLLGFSQGAAMAAALVCAHQTQRRSLNTGEMQFRFVILRSGFGLTKLIKSEKEDEQERIRMLKCWNVHRFTYLAMSVAKTGRMQTKEAVSWLLYLMMVALYLLNRTPVISFPLALLILIGLRTFSAAFSKPIGARQTTFSVQGSQRARQSCAERQSPWIVICLEQLCVSSDNLFVLLFCKELQQTHNAFPWKWFSNVPFACTYIFFKIWK